MRNFYMQISVRNTLLIFLVLFSGFIYAQEEGGEQPMDYETISFPRSPESAAMSKHIDIPASTYNGVASFSVPIYTIEIEGNQIPVSIDYSTSGIKVGEVASNVGLGWSLSLAGLSLSRQIIGSPDQTTRPSFTDIEAIDDDNYLLELSDAINGYNDSYSEELMELPKDMQPDIYSYGTLNGSGHFIFHSTENKGIPIPYNQVEITHNESTDFIKIIDEKGIQYFFSKSFNSQSHNSCSSNLTILTNYNYSDYFIRKIIFPSGKELYFESENDPTTYSYYTSYSMTVKKNYSPATAGQNPNPGTKDFICFNSSENAINLLKEINFDGGKLTIIYSDENERTDIIGSKYIKQIIVTNEKNDTIRDFSFIYDYFESLENDGKSDFVPNGNLKNGIFKRLKLTELKDNLTQASYGFKYYGDDNGEKLPHRLSMEQDHWGVYNGKYPTNKIYGEYTSIGTSRYHTLGQNENIQRVLLGADKSADFDYGVIGNLKEIHYPTGGYTKIQYESDDYYNPNNTEYQYERHSTPLISNNQEPEYPSIINFTISGDAVYEAYLECYRDGDMPEEDPFAGPNHGIPGSGMGDASVQILGEGIDEIIDCPSLKPYLNNLSPGSYSLQIYNETAPPMGEESETYYAFLNYITETESVGDYNTKVGTIRVSEIEKFQSENDENPVLKKRFHYKDSNGHSTGVNHGDDDLRSFSRQQYPVNRTATPPTFGDILNFSSSPGRNLNTVSGKAVGYSSVIEETLSDNASFKVKQEFHNELDENYVLFNPYEPLNISWRNPSPGLRGKPKMITYFDSQNNTIKTEEFKYDSNNYFNKQYDLYPENSGYSETLMFGFDINRKLVVCVTGCIVYHNYKYFHINNTWLRPIETTTTEYIDNLPAITTKEFTKYSPKNNQGNPLHTFPIERKVKNSLGEFLSTEFEYPQDLSLDYGQEDIIDMMIARNMVATPIRTTSKNENIILSDRLTVYDTISGTGSNVMVLPKFVFAKKGELPFVANAEDRKITYDHYDSIGNLIQYKLENGIPVSIIWGYNGLYPIAKVEGAEYSQINNLAGALREASDLGVLNAASFETLRNLEGVMVTGYIYDPLVGVTVIIQPNGQKMTYEYDNSGRLKQVKDHNDDIIQEIEYKYHNQ